tara:strand:+ start:2629 stop:2820 length:192 start_codon:yes stop_codon:yes gene_type:complete
MITFKEFLNQGVPKELRQDEDAAVNSVAAGGVNMNVTGGVRKDKRSKWSMEHMHRRASGAFTK